MASNFSFVKVNNINTIELIDIVINIDTSKFRNLRRILDFLYLEHEKEAYKKIEEDLKEKVKANEDTSRRIICTYSPTDNESDWCMSLFHLLLKRPENKLIVYMRSLNIDYILSDLAFLINLALSYDANLSVHIGSLHKEATS